MQLTLCKTYGLVSVDMGTYYIADQLIRLWLIE